MHRFFPWWILLLENSLLETIVKCDFLIPNCIFLQRRVLTLMTPVCRPSVYLLDPSAYTFAYTTTLEYRCILFTSSPAKNLSFCCLYYKNNSFFFFFNVHLVPPTYYSGMWEILRKTVMHSLFDGCVKVCLGPGTFCSMEIRNSHSL